MIKKRQEKNLNQILLSGYSSVDSEEVDQAEGASDQAKRGNGRHLQVYRYLQAGGPIVHSLSRWQYRTPTTNQWTFQTSSNG